MTSKEFLADSLSTIFRALNTMDGLLYEVRATIPDHILNNESPEDVDNGENLDVTFFELTELQTSCDDMINGLLGMSDDDTGESAFSWIDLIEEQKESINENIDRILGKYKGDAVSDEY